MSVSDRSIKESVAAASRERRPSGTELRKLKRNKNVGCVFDKVRLPQPEPFQGGGRDTGRGAMAHVWSSILRYCNPIQQPSVCKAI